VARLDPLARHDFMAILMAAVAEEGISVLFSSHVVSELERVCDYLVVLNHGKVQVAGDVEDLLESHRIFTGPTADAAAVAPSLLVVQAQQGDRQTSLLARTAPEFTPPEGWAVGPTNLEELVLAYLRSGTATSLPGPRPSNSEMRASA
jgi:ABC-2 type transport system ATP-binding protein